MKRLRARTEKGVAKWKQAFIDIEMQAIDEGWLSISEELLRKRVQEAVYAKMGWGYLKRIDEEFQ